MKKVKKLFLLAAMVLTLLCSLILMSSAANVAADIENGDYGACVATGSCYNGTAATNATWSVYNSKTSGKYTLYFTLDTAASSNTVLHMGFDPQKNDGAGGGLGWSTAWNDAELAKLPWGDYRANIDTLVIGDGFTTVSGWMASHKFSTIELPRSLTRLGGQTFMDCLNVSCCYVRGNKPVLYEADLSCITKFGGYEFKNWKQIKSIKLSEDLTGTIGGQAFGETRDLVSVTIPAGVTKIDALAFDKCNKLTSVTVLGTATEIADNAFSATAPIEKFICYPGTPAYSFAVANGYTVEFPATGIMEAVSSDSSVRLSLDFATGKLSVVKASSAVSFNAADEKVQSFLRSVAPAVKSAEVDDFELISFAMTEAQKNEELTEGAEKYFNIFAYLPEIKTVVFKGDNIRFDTADHGKGLFEGSIKLTTVGFGGKTAAGVAELSGFAGNSADHPENYAVNLFAGCASLTSVVLPSDPLFTTVESSTFAGCISLLDVTLPENISTVEDYAFVGCLDLNTAYVLNKNCAYTVDGDNAAFPEGVRVTSDPIPELVSALSMEGFAVRFKSYNGLRSIFYFDNTGNAAKNVNGGYTLVEYGALIVSSANRALYGSELTYSESSDSYEAQTKGLVKLQIKNGNRYTGKVLSVNSDGTGQYPVKGATYFGCAITNYTDNYTSDVYFCGYEVWEINGKKQIIYTDFVSSGNNSEFNETSIYNVSLGMYKDGAINAATDTENIVWNTLTAGGAVTLNKANGDYTVPEGLMDMEGNAFGDTFTAKEIVLCSLNGSSLSRSSTNFTLLHDIGANEGKYVIAFRGTGNIPLVLLWLGGSSTRLQYGSKWLDSSVNANYGLVTNSPNPVFSAATAKKISYAVVDEGITAMGVYMFASTYADTNIKTVVYASSVNNISGAFQNGVVTKAFRAGTPKAYIEEGLLDFGYSNIVTSNLTFNGASGIKKVRLPAGMSALKDGAFNSNKTLERVWCSNDITDRGTYGVADLSGASFTRLIENYFASTNSSNPVMTTLRLPDTCVEIASNALNSSSIKKVEQKTFNQTVSDFCTANGITYVSGSDVTGW